MDKRSILSFILIGIVITAWLLWQSSQNNGQTEQKPKAQDTSAINDSIRKLQDTAEQKTATENILSKDTLKAAKPDVFNDSLAAFVEYGSFAPFLKGENEYITIETDLIKATISKKGGTILRWQLKNYKSWNGYPAQLISNKGGELFLTFMSLENKKIDTRDLYFTLDNTKSNYRLTGKDSLVLTANLAVAPGKSIIKKYTFFGNKYHINSSVSLIHLESLIPSRGYNYNWSDGLKYQELNSVDESGEALSMASLNGDIEELDASDNDPKESSLTGLIDYAAVKSKYFGAAIIPQPYKQFDGTVDLSGNRKHFKNEGVVERYNISFRVPYAGGDKTNTFQIYIGPLDYDIVSGYGLEDMVSFGWRLVIRPIGEYFMLPIFTFIHDFVPNFGISIILFSILMKILLYPLSIQQMRSSQKMQLLGPELTKLRAQYKDDQSAQQKETMKLYSQYGINPMGGCLPLLLQMPILYALWSVLRSAIALRQADFFLWINDLSLPDTIYTIPFSLLGIKHISGLALAMGVTMFFQQKMTITDPRQKGMVYMMPIMFTLMFSNFPSGLNLYYFMFNLLSIGQQVYINKFSRKKLTLADMKKMPKKEGWFQKKMREAQEIAEAQGRSIPGKKYSTEKGGSTGQKKQPIKKTYQRGKKKK